MLVRRPVRRTSVPDMQILMFVTDDGRSPEGTGPALFVKADPHATLPAHPRGFGWRYFATIGLDDALIAGERPAIAEAIENGLSYISRRLVFVPA